MSITDELHRLGNSARQLNAGSDSLNVAIERIDGLLGRLMIGLEYVHPRPLAEQTAVDVAGKRVIELVYVGYLKVDRHYHLAIRTTKVLESRLQIATQSPGQITALLNAPRQLRFAAVDMLPEVIAGLAVQVDEMVAAMNRRQETAEALLRRLEAIAQSSESSGGWALPVELGGAPGRAAASAPAGQAPSPSPSASGSLPDATAARTEYYPGTGGEATRQGDGSVHDGHRRLTVPIGSGDLRRVQDAK